MFADCPIFARLGAFLTQRVATVPARAEIALSTRFHAAEPSPPPASRKLSARMAATKSASLPSSLEDQSLVPAVGILREAGALYPYDAEALAGRRLHHHPALQLVHHLGA